MRIKQAVASVATAAGVSTAVTMTGMVILLEAVAHSSVAYLTAFSAALAVTEFAYMLMMCAIVMLPIFGWAGRPTVRTAVIAGLATGLPWTAWQVIRVCLGQVEPTGLPGIIAAIAINEGAPVAGAGIGLIVWIRMASQPVKEALV